jgi:hypothetical protein
MTSKLNSHLVIGLAGRHDSGKTTIVNQLELILSNHDFLVEVITIGNNISKELAEATGGGVEVIQRLKKDNPLTRWLLEKMGCEYFKPEDLYKNVSETIDAIKIPHIILIDGLRRPSDEMFVHERYKGIVIMITRDLMSADRKNYVPKPELLPSEVDLNKVRADYYFANDHNSLVRMRYELRHLIFDEVFNNPSVIERLT